ncbi:MAG: thioredoxin [Euryarchaeota archaeon RBG_16_68_13]|nr:MAG: thioredoxin [Euryarchaeota archaeon RBG_16_68_13]
MATTGGKPFTVTDTTFEAEVRKPGLLLVDFWADWCAPCHRIAPVLEQMAKDLSATLRVGKLNVDENPATAQRFEVMSIPTMLLFKDGKLVDGVVGALPRVQIEAMVRRWT